MTIACCFVAYLFPDRMKRKLHTYMSTFICTWLVIAPLRKVMEGGGEKCLQKIHAWKNAKKKNSCKEDGKEKKVAQNESPIVTFI